MDHFRPSFQRDLTHTHTYIYTGDFIYKFIPDLVEFFWGGRGANRNALAFCLLADLYNGVAREYVMISTHTNNIHCLDAAGRCWALQKRSFPQHLMKKGNDDDDDDVRRDI